MDENNILQILDSSGAEMAICPFSDIYDAEEVAESFVRLLVNYGLSEDDIISITSNVSKAQAKIANE